MDVKLLGRGVGQVNTRMLVEFVDGSKTMVEMVAIANCTGLVPDVPGMHGPDGLAMDEAGNLLVAHPRVRIIWLFDPIGAPILQIHGKSNNSRMTNMAYGGTDRKTLYIVDSYSGEVLTAKMPVAGKVLYSHT